jgi:hypothetical protein
MADVLENCAVDPSHQPAIYAAFIREIVRKTKETRASSPAPAASAQMAAAALLNGSGNMQQNNNNNSNTNAMYDPQLMGETADWQPDLLNMEAAQFAFIPQGGDMM